MPPVAQPIVTPPANPIPVVPVKEVNKKRKWIIISSVVTAGVLLAFILLLTLSTNGNPDVNNSAINNNTGTPVQNNQNVSNDYPEFLPVNVCPDSLVQEGDRQFALYDGKKYAMQLENFQYYDANCKSSASNGSQGQDYGPNYNNLETCSNQPIFDTLPVDLTNLQAIVPLGNIGVPDHAFPTDHMYFTLNRTAEDLTGEPIPTNIKSPGNIVVTTVSRTAQYRDGQNITDDYGLEFTGCKGNSYYFGHIQVINNPKLKAEIDSIPESQCVRGTPADNTEIINCTKKIDIIIASGEQIGIVGGPKTPGFDLGAYSDTLKLNFINQKIFPPKTANALCPLDSFNENIKSQAYSILDRKGEPLCGSVMQDIAGTAQGNWLFGDTTKYETYSNWNGHISLVHDNLDTSIGVVGIAGIVTSPKILMYSPQSSGEVNRDPSQITPGNTIYCYQSEEAVASFKYVTGSLLVQLVDETSIMIEWRENDCSDGNYILTTNAKQYSR